MKLAHNFLPSLHFTHSTILSINVNTIYYKFSQEKKRTYYINSRVYPKHMRQNLFDWGKEDLICLSIQFNNTVNLV